MTKLIFTLAIGILLLNVQKTDAQFFELFKNEIKKQKLMGDDIEIPFTTDEAAKAIKEALTKGVKKGTDLVSKKNGFLKNPEIKIPFPKDAKKVEKTLRRIGLGKKVDKAVESMNRAAELAAIEAKDVFVSAIKDMSISDAMEIVKGEDDSATRYLESSSNKVLTKKFTPIIKAALKKVDATKHWKTVISAYNKVPFVSKVNPDLTDYVTKKALEGLFVMIEKEEKEIREDPVARTTDLLKKVFGIK